MDLEKIYVFNDFELKLTRLIEDFGKSLESLPENKLKIV
jgi:hypothetical protein